MFASDNFSRELVPYQSRNIVEYLGQVLHEPRETLLSALKRTSPLIIVSGMALGSYYVGFPLLSTLLNHSDVRQVTETPLVPPEVAPPAAVPASREFVVPRSVAPPVQVTRTRHKVAGARRAKSEHVEPVLVRTFAASPRDGAPMMRGLPLPLLLRIFFADLFGLQRP